jgi:hypothetical protein
MNSQELIKTETTDNLMVIADKLIESNRPGAREALQLVTDELHRRKLAMGRVIVTLAYLRAI